MALDNDKSANLVGTESIGKFTKKDVIGTSVAVCTYESAVAAVIAWSGDREATYTTAHVNTHGTVVGTQNQPYLEAVNGCDLVTPDGWPVVKFLRRLGEKQDDRVYGPDLMELICAEAAKAGIPIGIYGGKAETLDALEKALLSRYPDLVIAYKHSPPFRPLTDDEKTKEDDAMRSSGARIYFIGLGCPKQELYVHEKKVRAVPGVFMAVGAAIDINSGTQRRCPEWMKQHGFEWLFRLMQDPKRLWKRYATYPYQFYRLTRKQIRSSRAGQS